MGDARKEGWGEGTGCHPCKDTGYVALLKRVGGGGDRDFPELLVGACVGAYSVTGQKMGVDVWTERAL